MMTIGNFWMWVCMVLVWLVPVGLVGILTALIAKATRVLSDNRLKTAKEEGAGSPSATRQ